MKDVHSVDKLATGEQGMHVGTLAYIDAIGPCLLTHIQCFRCILWVISGNNYGIKGDDSTVDWKTKTCELARRGNLLTARGSCARIHTALSRRKVHDF
jgi:hypothetical protein